jgi:hypothetical protein
MYVQGEGFSSTQLYYSSFSIYSLSCYIFRSYDDLQSEICVSNYTTDNGSVVISVLVSVMDDNSDRFLVIVDLVAVAALIIANCYCTLFAGRCF